MSGSIDYINLSKLVSFRSWILLDLTYDFSSFHDTVLISS